MFSDTKRRQIFRWKHITSFTTWTMQNNSLSQINFQICIFLSKLHEFRNNYVDHAKLRKFYVWAQSQFSQSRNWVCSSKSIFRKLLKVNKRQKHQLLIFQLITEFFSCSLAQGSTVPATQRALVVALVVVQGSADQWFWFSSCRSSRTSRSSTRTTRTS